MNPMFAAIKNRKMGVDHGHESHQSPQPSGDHGDKSSGVDLHGLVASLSGEQKFQLLSLLHTGAGNKIEQGAPSSQEQGKIAQKMEAQEGSPQEEMTESPNDESSEDDIAMSMLDSKFKHGVPPEQKPRNLSERVKMDLASKLKGKGKL